MTLYTGVVGGICSTAKTFAKPIKTSLQPSYNTEKEAVSSAEVKPWLLENKQTKKRTDTFLAHFLKDLLALALPLIQV